MRLATEIFSVDITKARIYPTVRHVTVETALAELLVAAVVMSVKQSSRILMDATSCSKGVNCTP